MDMERAADPARRDQDNLAWRPGRFEERIRRQWNHIPSEAIEAAGDDLDKLAETVHDKVGGELDEVRHRLEQFRLAERQREVAPSEDPLLRPGAKV